MRLPTRQGTQASRRIFGGLGVLVVFGAFFVLPLCAALTLCTMPCCHHGNRATGGPIVSGVMTPCETECGVRSADATLPAVVSVAPHSISRASMPVVACVELHAGSAAGGALAHEDEPSHHRASASAQVLNSVFRI